MNHNHPATTELLFPMQMERGKIEKKKSHKLFVLHMELMKQFYICLPLIKLTRLLQHFSLPLFINM
jgi:hypothetical protein